jgi:hypothetical protein
LKAFERYQALTPIAHFGRKGRGYLALYQYVDEIDTVFVLAVQSQREAGYART